MNNTINKLQEAIDICDDLKEDMDALNEAQHPLSRIKDKLIESKLNLIFLSGELTQLSNNINDLTDEY